MLRTERRSARSSRWPRSVRARWAAPGGAARIGRIDASATAPRRSSRLRPWSILLCRYCRRRARESPIGAVAGQKLSLSAFASGAAGSIPNGRHIDLSCRPRREAGRARSPFRIGPAMCDNNRAAQSARRGQLAGLVDRTAIQIFLLHIGAAQRSSRQPSRKSGPIRWGDGRGRRQRSGIPGQSTPAIPRGRAAVGNDRRASPRPKPALGERRDSVSICGQIRAQAATRRVEVVDIRSWKFYPPLSSPQTVVIQAMMHLTAARPLKTSIRASIAKTEATATGAGRRPPVAGRHRPGRSRNIACRRRLDGRPTGSGSDGRGNRCCQVIAGRTERSKGGRSAG